MLVDTYMACWSLLAFSGDYHRILQKSRITCVVLIDPFLGVPPASLHIAFLCMRYLSKISIRCLVLRSYVLNIYLMHVFGILFGLKRIVCVTMYVYIVYFLDFTSIFNVCSISQECC
jgi:hypothetical protein